MNLNKLKNITNTKSINDSFENFIQTARMTEELEKMNVIVTFDDAKNYLINLLKDNPNYEIFDNEKEIARMRHIVIPKDGFFGKDSFVIWDHKRYCGFLVKTSEDLNKFYNFALYGFSNNKNDFTALINAKHEFDDIKEKINFYINSYSYIDEVKFNKFEDLEIDYNWYLYNDMNNLTEDCIKFNEDCCKIKDCKNCNKCNMFMSKLEYTTNMYKFNNLINKLVELMCKESKVPVTISKELIDDDHTIRYTIGKLGIDIFTSSKKDKLYSSASIKVYTNDKMLVPLFVSDSKLYSNNGKEQFSLYFNLLHEYAKEKKTWIKYMKKK